MKNKQKSPGFRPWAFFYPEEAVHILKLGVPIAFVQLANFALNVEDVAFVGRLGVIPLGGISVGNALFTVFMIGAIGFLLSLDYLISHAYGEGNQTKANSYLAHGIYLTLLVGVPLSLLIYFSPVLLAWMQQDPAIVIQATLYLKTIAWSLWPFLIFSVFRQFLQAIGVATPTLIILLLANGVNILANWCLVFGAWGFPRLDIVGSGLATVIARFFMATVIALYTLYYCHKKKIHLFTRASWQFSPEKSWDIIRMGAPAAGQVLMEIGAFAGATLLAGKVGAIPLAAHQSALQIASISFMIPLGISSAGAVRVAQSLGAGHPERAVRVGWTSIFLGAGIMACFGIIMVFIPHFLVSFFTPDAEVIRVGAQLMLIAAFFQLFDGAQVVSTGVLRGIGNTKASFLTNFAGYWIIGLPLGAFLAFKLNWGVFGIWTGLSTGLILVALTLIVAWHRLSLRFLRQKHDGAHGVTIPPEVPREMI